MGRISLFTLLFTLSVSQLSAQSGGNSNLEFVENKGQWDSQVKYRANMGAGMFIMQKSGFTVVQHDTADLRRIEGILHGEISRSASAFSTGGKTAGNTNDRKVAALNKTSGPGKGGAGVPGDSSMTLHSHSYRVSFDMANEQVEIVPDKALPYFTNYIKGNDPSKWVTKARGYRGVVYKNIYQGIDLHYYTDGKSLKYDIVVHPGANPDQITMKYEGQQQLSIKKNQVNIRTSIGTAKEMVPRSYQYNDVEKKDVECNYYITSGNRVKFKIKNYSPDATLVIDPTLVFCSFTGSQSDNWGYTATYDASGDFYVGGIVLDDDFPGGNDFLVNPGAFQSTYGGGDGSEGSYTDFQYNYDVGIKKFSSDGSKILYATYLGGSGDEQPHSMVCDAVGDLIVTGRTSSTNFPTFPSTLTAGQGKGFDLFITKFKPDGTGVIGSRRIGGSGSDGVNYLPKYVGLPQSEGTHDLRTNYGDDGRGEVILDATGNIYIATCTQSPDFPFTAGGFQPKFGDGGQDGIFLKLSPDLSQVLACSYIGGSQPDAAFVLGLNPINNNIYIAGGTMSTDLPGISGNAVQTANKGGADGFVTIVDNSGAHVLGGTYFGTAGTDIIFGLDFDKQGFLYIMGTTTNVIPVVNSPFNTSTANNGKQQAGGKQFITKLKMDLSGIIYSANFGPSGTPFPQISPTAFLVDRCENVYVSGWGGGLDTRDNYNNSGTNGLTATSGAIRSTTDNADFYFFVLQKNAASQLYGSFFGQVDLPNRSLGDHVDGGTSRFDSHGIIYQSVCANCGGPDNIFPTTPGAAELHNGALPQGCNEAAVKIAFNFAGVAAGLKTTLKGRGDSLGCIPLYATFQDTIRNAVSYIWNFGDGSPILNTTSYIEEHAYTTVGTYKVTLIAADPNSCNGFDTVYQNITARSDSAHVDFKYGRPAGVPCTSFEYLFTNLSVPYGGKSFGNQSFQWIFGDGSNPPGLTGDGDVIYSYPAPGPYNVSLILVDTNFCNAPDTVTKPLYVAQNVKAQFITPANGCAPYYATFNNTSIAGQTFYWNFGDDSPIDSVDRTPPPHYYPIGVYTINLKVVDSTTCNIVSDTSVTITVHAAPTAAFSFEPTPPVANTPDIFTNLSTDAVQYKWIFGDGTSTTRTTMDTVMHQYDSTYTFNACLVAINQFGCSDTACHPVAVLINPLLDVPNAFTPGRFGQNGIVKVVGFGITKMIWRIYNRWGQMVFESNDPNTGWDGTFSGKAQPMDVYAYTLEASFFDGKHETKKGDITLLR